uniref:Uncharacterized protein n=1 Tax=Anguilla anguilla TaxID=7936 RepID=A0A0E9RH80_ANGAN
MTSFCVTCSCLIACLFCVPGTLGWYLQ